MVAGGPGDALTESGFAPCVEQALLKWIADGKQETAREYLVNKYYLSEKDARRTVKYLRKISTSPLIYHAQNVTAGVKFLQNVFLPTNNNSEKNSDC